MQIKYNQWLSSLQLYQNVKVKIMEVITFTLDEASRSCSFQLSGQEVTCIIS